MSACCYPCACGFICPSVVQIAADQAKAVGPGAYDVGAADGHVKPKIPGVVIATCSKCGKSPCVCPPEPGIPERIEVCVCVTACVWLRGAECACCTSVALTGCRLVSIVRDCVMCRKRRKKFVAVLCCLPLR